MSAESVTWPTLKAVLDGTTIHYSYIGTTDFYYIFTNGPIPILCNIARDGGTFATEWEASYKAAAVDFTYTHINKFHNMTGNATTTIKSGIGILRGISINNNTTGGTVTIYDNTAASGTKIMTLQVGSPSGGLLTTTGLAGPTMISGLDIKFGTGLTVVTAGSANNNVSLYYR